jgi:hypothetical protein
MNVEVATVKLFPSQKKGERALPQIREAIRSKKRSVSQRIRRRNEADKLCRLIDSSSQ